MKAAKSRHSAEKRVRLAGTGLFRIALVVMGCLLLTPFSINALELYSIIHKDCETSTGLIIHVDRERVYQININGKLSTVARKGIEHVLVYNTIDNPFSRLHLDSGLGDYIREVQVSAGDNITFTGWPIRFVDDLIVFFDLEGKTHLVETGDIQKFTKPDSVVQSAKTIVQFQKMQFGFGNNLPGCSRVKTDGGGITQPTRMLSDQIRIQKFLSVYHAGFTQLKKLQKRTIFYARPYVFEKDTKIALVVIRNDFQEEFSAGLPLYFQWPSGKTFGPQGLLAVGLKPIEHLPSVEPVFGLRFDGKHHFFHATFAGNPFAFSSGAGLIIENRFYLERYFSKKDADDFLFLPQFNQVALTGLDWGPYSLSAGYYYPVYGIQANGIFRELLSESASAIFKAQYTAQDLRFQAVISGVNLGSDSPNGRNINLIYAEEMAQGSSKTARSRQLETMIEKFSFEGGFLRLNLDLDLTRKARLGISEVIILGDYQETISGEDYQLRFDHYVTSVNVHQDFGESVALKGYLNYYLRNYHSQSEQTKSQDEESAFSFSIAVEFIL